MTGSRTALYLGVSTVEKLGAIVVGIAAAIEKSLVELGRLVPRDR